MAEITQYTLTHVELIDLIIKQNDIHEGKWALLLGIGVGTGMFGPKPEETFPGAVVTVNQIGIQRILPGAPSPGTGSVIVDAAVVNPQKKAPKVSRAKRRR